MAESITGELPVPEPLKLDIGELPKGIDNYHNDVQLSTRFCADLKKLVSELLRFETGRNIGGADKDREQIFVPLRQSYLDMMTVLIHRIKTDLSELEIRYLQFAVPKQILQAVTAALNEHINNAKLRASELRAHGSAEVLRVHQQLAWLSKHYNSILYRINRQIFSQLHRAELRQLQGIRAQYLHDRSIDFTEFLFNPLLLNRDLNSPLFLIEHYVYWGGSGEDNEFPALNQEIELLLGEAFEDLPILPLKPPESDPPLPTEVFDELGGLHAVRPFMGAVTDSKNQLMEEFCWLDSPANVQKLFDLEALEEKAAALRGEKGFRAGREARKQLKAIRHALKRTAALLQRRGMLKPLAASYQTRRIWGKSINIMTDPRLLCQHLSGQIPLARLLDTNLGGHALNEEELSVLKESHREIAQDCGKLSLQLTARILADLATFRRHLKYFRFAHRLFNRLSILSSTEHLRLSRQAGTLYHLPCASEVEEDQDRIAHHTIMKADVRGSTTVTAQLEALGLNPASHFSLHFFDPINKLLPVYGAGKVFIEGDAIILSFLEYENIPQHWFSVAQACGLARAMLGIIHANNQHARQLGLPPLETGIGICHSDESPRFLFDGDRPIMISSAIGAADRLSSSSWKLRDQIKAGPFNVEVLEIAEGEREHGEKGQQFMRYNINGILLADDAFRKLQNEVRLRRLSARIDGRQVTLHCGEFPDLEGKRRSVVVREGRTGLWQHGTVTLEAPSGKPFYEVVSNPKIISQVQTGLGTPQTEEATGSAAGSE